MGDTHYISHQLYSSGYEEAHAEAGLKVDPTLMATIELNAEEGYAGTERLMKQRKRPDALIVPSDRSAIGALKAMRDLRIKVPADIGLLSLDGTYETVFTNPPLTAVEMPWYEMLALSTTLLIGMVEDRPPIEQIGIRFASRLVIRESTRVRS